ncbi:MULTISPECIES: DUF3558 domain-containing protein [unclassified Saccharopolyspora]|uniref:DUF3558 domain-containing protein n=1 Tax=unclassified Saccharopolyspora TaxID=2646250 RepID=UPI001CD6AF98|nr:MULTISPECIES: DUF3558 domain-containing protein [unclassified Saccharopolyspora]MCA1190231.1 DUF3558 domain-containing protein [Saccharopolyspora sp. 6T]MCA1280058.1 DUF3558 domain-containing protein [Saccharopolyspora sp. 7B]
MLRRAILAATSLVIAGGISACGLTGNEQTAPESAPEPQVGGDPALAVDQPKTVAAVTDACRLLTPEQLSTLGAEKNGEPGTTTFGEPKCDWSTEAFAFSVGLYVKTGGDAEQIYRSADNHDNFAPTRIGEYPAARVNAQSSTCSVEVGISDSESVTIDYTKYSGGTPEVADPCGYAEKIATEVLNGIP